MNMFKKALLSASIAAATSGVSLVANADSFTDALKASKVSGNFNLRYEDVDVTTKDSDGLTLRSRITVTTGSVGKFNAVVEFEDTRDVLGIDDEGSLIADPEHTELDQAFVQYKSDAVTTKVGRQVLTLDGHRFVGHVGWRQDRQTFDAVTATFKPVDGLDVFAGYIYKRNRILGEAADFESNDLLLNAGYKTPIGKVVGYAYLLDNDVTDKQIDTYGLSLTGATDGDVKVMYAAEFATQSIELASGADFDTDYMKFEVGTAISGVTAKIGYELLGSDDGLQGFATPLATLHKFNGWADKFLGTPANGLEDTYVSVGGKLGGFGLLAVIHDFSADEGSSDYGSEWDVSAVKKFGSGYTFGLKYASYDADDFSVDTDKLWIWLGLAF